MVFENLSDFVSCYNPRNRHDRKATWDEEEAPEGAGEATAMRR